MAIIKAARDAAAAMGVSLQEQTDTWHRMGTSGNLRDLRGGASCGHMNNSKAN